MKPKVIFESGKYRIVALLNQAGNPQIWFEVNDGRDAMEFDRWIDAPKYELSEMLNAIAIKIAKEKLP